MRTHYDNLKVSHDAPIEVINAAYRALAKKYHPDKNGDSAESERILKIINEAHEILCDPARRKRYDKLIADKELNQQEVNLQRTHHQKQPTPQQPIYNTNNTNKTERHVSEKAKSAFWFGMASLIFPPIGIVGMIYGHRALKEIEESYGTVTGKCYAYIGIDFGCFTFFFCFIIPLGLLIFNIYY